MKDKFKPIANENQTMIVLGILALYGLITGFIIYLYLLHRITIIPCILSTFVFTLIYLPRLLIIRKLKNKDEIKILKDSILINNKQIKFEEIKDFRTAEKKPQVIFFISNKMVVFQECKFYLRLTNEQTDFTAIGTEKIKLLKEFFNNIIN